VCLALVIHNSWYYKDPSQLKSTNQPIKPKDDSHPGSYIESTTQNPHVFTVGHSVGYELTRLLKDLGSYKQMQTFVKMLVQRDLVHILQPEYQGQLVTEL
jgi:hypothetical protein